MFAAKIRRPSQKWRWKRIRPIVCDIHTNEPNHSVVFRSKTKPLQIAWLCPLSLAAYYIGVVWVLAAVVGGRKLRDVAREFALLLLVQHAVMLPWAVRNHAYIGRFTFLTTSSGMALFTGNNDHATGLWYPGWLDDLEASHPGISRASVVEQDDAAKKEAMRWKLGNPIRAVELYVSKLGWIFTEDRHAAEWTTNEAFWRPEATGGPTGGSAADGRQWLVT